MTLTTFDAQPHIDTLLAHQKEWQHTSLNELFQSDPHRAERYQLEAAGLYLDYSKNHLTAETLELLTTMAQAAKLPEAIKALISGEEVNNTEKRPALHTALRFKGEPKTAKEREVSAALEQMEALVDKLHRQQWLGFSGKPITDVVNIGIGGSDLGPRMMVDALTAYHHPNIKLHFVANVDPSELGEICKKINPETSLFIVASKSFTTLETLENALSARRWLQQHGCNHEQLQNHFIAISSKPDLAKDFGINPDNVLPMWDWVGGRYSLWSAIGLPIALAVGMSNFRSMLAGAADMDTHFSSAPVDQNMPALLGLIGFWYSQCWNAQSQAVLPYSHHMHHFPAFLQQLDMESLGKHVSRNGDRLRYNSGSIIWGTEGTNGQHSFHQLLHQGTHLIPVDFIATLNNGYDNPTQTRHLFACCISQSQALLKGKTIEQASNELIDKGMPLEEAKALAPHMEVAGNRPSNTLILNRLTPYTMGALTALYEHKVYTLSVLLGLNAFDQWGVEIGKQLGKNIYNALESGNIPSNWDASTALLAKKFISEA